MDQNHTTETQIAPRKFAFFALAGAAIAFGFISIFVFGVDNPNPDWPINWRTRPLLLTPLAGAAGGAFVYFITSLKSDSKAVRMLLLLFGIFGFVIALWIGIVLGLDGTMWD